MAKNPTHVLLNGGIEVLRRPSLAACIKSARKYSLQPGRAEIQALQILEGSGNKPTIYHSRAGADGALEFSPI